VVYFFLHKNAKVFEYVNSYKKSIQMSSIEENDIGNDTENDTDNETENEIENNNEANSLDHLSFSTWIEPLEEAIQSRATRSTYTKISVRSFQEQIDVPRVAFGSARIFDLNIEKFLREMSRFIRSMVWSWLSVEPGSSRLTWTRRDMLLNGMADFPEFFSNGRVLLAKLTMGKGLAWCDFVISRMAEIILAAYRVYVRAIIGWKPELDKDIFVLGLQNELVTSMYETAHILNPLFHRNFLSIYYNDRQAKMDMFRIVAREVWEEILIAFVSGLHPRLGQDSEIFMLNVDIMIVLRRYLI